MMERKEALDIIIERIDLAERKYSEQVPQYIEALKLSAELLQADAEGRLVVLPCKVGDTVFEIIEESVHEHYFYIQSYKVQDVSAKAVKYAGDWTPLDEKNLYFSKEEAEAALEKEGWGRQRAIRLFEEVERIEQGLYDGEKNFFGGIEWEDIFEQVKDECGIELGFTELVKEG